MSALSHLRVVEFGAGVSAPFCARLFADMGAEVIKLEPASGDITRQWGPFEGDQPNPEKSGSFHFLNAGKRSVVTDLDREEDRHFFHKLLAGADVFIENLEFNQRQAWGLDFAELAERHPHLVVVSLSPYGRAGLWRDRAGVDLTVQAVSAMCMGLGKRDMAPLALPYDQAEYQCGLHGMAAALCALFERESSGQGQGIDMSSAHVLGFQVGGMSLVTAKAGHKWQRAGDRLRGGLYPTGFYEVADGYVCIASQHGRQWHTFIELMGTPAWSKDEQNLDVFFLGSTEDGHPVDEAFRAWLKCSTREQLLAIGKEHNIIIGSVHTADEVLESPQFEFRDHWGEIPIGDKVVKLPKPGYLFSETPVAITTPAPGLNADGDSIRSELPAPLSLTEGPRRQGALQGVRVLDFGWNWAGPLAGQILADMGAEVIRIESSLRQDNMRAMPAVSWFFCNNNRSKKSASFNLATPEGIEQVHALVKISDIVMDNFAAGVMTKNRLGYEDLKKLNPEIIAVSMSMAGQQGPEKGMRGFASIASAYAGLEGMVGYPQDNKASGLMTFGLGDTTQGVQGAIGALAALAYRGKTGMGQFVDLSQNASMAGSMGLPLLDYQLNGRVAGPQGVSHIAYVPQGIYPVKGDDSWVALAVCDHNQWQALCRLIGKPNWAVDASLADTKGRRAREEEIGAAISRWTSQRGRDQAVEELTASGVVCAPVLELAESADSPALSATPQHWKHDQGRLDPCEIYALPWQLTATPPTLGRPTPVLGENNDYVYKDLLNLSEETIAALQQKKALT